MRYISILVVLIFFTSCAQLNNLNADNDDAIYGNKVKSKSGLYYKDYFAQKAQELNIQSRDSDDVLLTDIDSYISNPDTDLIYNQSYGSWGDDPSSFNLIVNNYNYPSLYNRYYFGYRGWYNYPFSYSWLPPYFGYEPYGWSYYPYFNYWSYYRWNPYYNNYPYYSYNNYYNRNVAYMNGRRGSVNYSKINKRGNAYRSDQKAFNGKDISTYNVSRIKDRKNLDEKKSEDKSDAANRRAYNRVYYTFNNRVQQKVESRTDDSYNNRRKIDFNKGSGNQNGKSNFQMSRYNSKTSSSNNTVRRSINRSNYTSSNRSYNSSNFRSNTSSRSVSSGSRSSSSSSSSTSRGKR